MLFAIRGARNLVRERCQHESTRCRVVAPRHRLEISPVTVVE
jgi:hypothetical protein